MMEHSPDYKAANDELNARFKEAWDNSNPLKSNELTLEPSKTNQGVETP
tara:strand:- start:11831 stop:11977 length:147 start_codon:yes stop_codon:yes gene_type:complete